jgi:hypothetical protein
MHADGQNMKVKNWLFNVRDGSGWNAIIQQMHVLGRQECREVDNNNTDVNKAVGCLGKKTNSSLIQSTLKMEPLVKVEMWTGVVWIIVFMMVVWLVVVMVMMVVVFLVMVMMTML